MKLLIDLRRVADKLSALLEAAAERQKLSPWQIYTENELLQAVGGGAVADVIEGG